jgi:two-component system, OmpR family, response regulator
MMDTILIVDDDAAIREIFTAYLEMTGYRILTAPGGKECLDLLKTQKPDLILLDMMMEPMDGWETLVAIRSFSACRHIPVIIVTGKPPVPEEIMQYGAFIEDFLQKPIDFKQIAESLHSIIEKDRVMRSEINRITKEGQDPAFLDEYIRLIRLVRVVHALKKRLKDPLWVGRLPLKTSEERLQWLHKKLALPDLLLERDEDR